MLYTVADTCYTFPFSGDTDSVDGRAIPVPKHSRDTYCMWHSNNCKSQGDSKQRRADQLQGDIKGK